MKNCIKLVIVLSIFLGCNKTNDENIEELSNSINDQIQKNNQLSIEINQLKETISSLEDELNSNDSQDVLDDVYYENIQYRIRGQSAFRVIENREYLMSGVTATSTWINNRRHNYFILDRSNETRLTQEQWGTYLFNWEGDLIEILPFGSTSESRGIFFSPDGKYFGVDGGTFVLRGMTFYSFKEYEEIGNISYIGDIFWRENTVIYTTHRNEYIRYASWDPNHYFYIEVFNLSDNRKMVLYDYTELTNLFLHDFIHDHLIIIETIVDSIDNWRYYFDNPQYNVLSINYNYLVK